jgi:hypothetical protein
MAFWAAILSFIPAVFILILKPLWIPRPPKGEDLGIILIHQEISVEKEKGLRLKWLALVYGICFGFFVVVFLKNWFQDVAPYLYPFDLLSSFAVVMFWFSFISFIPVGAYVYIKQPWRYEEQELYLLRAMVVYGIAILIFSLIYVFRWSDGRPIMAQLLSGILIIMFAAAVIAYIPILIYTLMRSLYPKGVRAAQPQVIFAVYSVAFLIFAVIYFLNWMNDQKHGVLYTPISDMLNSP